MNLNVRWSYLFYLQTKTNVEKIQIDEHLSKRKEDCDCAGSSPPAKRKYVKDTSHLGESNHYKLQENTTGSSARGSGKLHEKVSTSSIETLQHFIELIGVIKCQSERMAPNIHIWSPVKFL